MLRLALLLLLAAPACAQRARESSGDWSVDIAALVEEAAGRAAQMPDAPDAGQVQVLLAGAAKVDITPAVGTPLQGYGYRFRAPSVGVHDPLHARVLVFKTGKSWAVFVGCDLTAVTGDFYQAIAKKVQESLPDVAEHRITVYATHTHSAASGLYKNFFAKLTGGPYQRRYFKETTEKVAAAVVEAAGKLEPVKLYFASGQVDALNENRASWAGGPVDRELGLLRVDGLDGRPIAWLVDFAAHPTTLGANLKFSADYPYYLYQKLEQDGAVALFANGAGADQGIRKIDGVSHEALAIHAGTTLAAKALELSKSAREVKADFDLGIERRQVGLPAPHARLFGRSRTRLSHGLNELVTSAFRKIFPRQADVGLIYLGDVLIMTLPGEFSAEIGLELKAKAAKLGYDLIVIGLANDYIGYVVPEARYDAKSYESKSSFYGPQLASGLEKSLVDMLPASRQRR